MKSVGFVYGWSVRVFAVLCASALAIFRFGSCGLIGQRRNALAGTS